MTDAQRRVNEGGTPKCMIFNHAFPVGVSQADIAAALAPLGIEPEDTLVRGCVITAAPGEPAAIDLAPTPPPLVTALRCKRCGCPLPGGKTVCATCGPPLTEEERARFLPTPEPPEAEGEPEALKRLYTLARLDNPKVHTEHLRAILTAWEADREALGAAEEQANLSWPGYRDLIDRLRTRGEKADAEAAALRAENERLLSFERGWHQIEDALNRDRFARAQEDLTHYVPRLKRERGDLKEEAEKYRTAARVLCGAHIGVSQETCPVCERDALKADLEKALDEREAVKRECEGWIARFDRQREEVVALQNLYERSERRCEGLRSAIAKVAVYERQQEGTTLCYTNLETVHALHQAGANAPPQE